jgi:hypothetical protein
MMKALMEIAFIVKKREANDDLDASTVRTIPLCNSASNIANSLHCYEKEILF